MSLEDLFQALNLASGWFLLAALYYVLVAYPLLKLVAWRRRHPR
jgi:hypothetical protein